MPGQLSAQGGGKADHLPTHTALMYNQSPIPAVEQYYSLQRGDHPKSRWDCFPVLWSSPVPVKFLLQPFFLCTPLQRATLQQHLGSRLPLASSPHTATEKAPVQGTHQCPILLYSPQARGDHVADSTSAQLCCGSGVGHRRDLLSFPPLA